MTKPYAEVIGDPIAHSKSPLIHNFWLQKLCIDAEYRATHVREEELADYFARRREDAAWRGCNVTVPHKVAAIAFADSADSEATAVGATNCVYPSGGRFEATNTDCVGVFEAIRSTPWPVCLIGNGGAARAALGVLDLLAAHDLRLLVRDKARGRNLLAELGYEGEIFDFSQAEAAIDGCDCVINATTLGMVGQTEMPDNVLRALRSLPKDGFVFDMVYAPLETQMLKYAREIGLETIDGLTMLIGQAGRAFFHFFDLEAPREHDTELRDLLTQR